MLMLSERSYAWELNTMMQCKLVMVNDNLKWLSHASYFEWNLGFHCARIISMANSQRLHDLLCLSPQENTPWNEIDWRQSVVNAYECYDIWRYHVESQWGWHSCNCALKGIHVSSPDCQDTILVQWQLMYSSKMWQRLNIWGWKKQTKLAFRMNLGAD
jgi:hypothetical protein